MKSLKEEKINPEGDGEFLPSRLDKGVGCKCHD